jgi:hypothetical protein
MEKILFIGWLRPPLLKDETRILTISASAIKISKE